MKKTIIAGIITLTFLTSCKKEQVVEPEVPVCEVENLGYLEVQNELGNNLEAMVYLQTSGEDPTEVEIILDGRSKIFEVPAGDVGCFINADTLTNGWLMDANFVNQCDTMVMTWMWDAAVQQLWFTYEPK